MITSAITYNKRQLATGALGVDHVVLLVEAFQRANGLEVDGFAGPMTIAALEALRQRSQSGLVLPAPRYWPLPELPDGRRPQITSRFHTVNPSRNDPDRPHRGVDVMYAYSESMDGDVRIGDGGAAGRGGVPRWLIPTGTVALAAADGKVTHASRIATGYRVWIDHGGVSTGYFHLATLLVAVGQEVAAGNVLGAVGDNPRDHDAKHLHFELHAGDLARYPSGSLDPELWLSGAGVLEDEIPF